MNKSEPLGLPTGSVRAVVVLIVDATACAQVLLAQVPSTALLMLAAVVSTFYFVVRSGDPVPEEVPDPIDDWEGE